MNSGAICAHEEEYLELLLSNGSEFLCALPPCHPIFPFLPCANVRIALFRLHTLNQRGLCVTLATMRGARAGTGSSPQEPIRPGKLLRRLGPRGLIGQQ